MTITKNVLTKTQLTQTTPTKTPLRFYGQAGAIALVALLASPLAWSHGDVTPQPVDIKGLELLGDEWLEENPYREDHPQHELAVDIGARAYNSNCAACHGLEAKSG